jgi:NAD(P)-dependent dehydrogenase (short-subunit alcohol dehydrogenase family)
MVNGAIEGFIRAAALELKDNKRVNAVSPKFIKETMELMGMDSSSGMPVNQVGFAYKESIEGNKTGKVLNAIDFTN